jgi:acetyltransferase
VLAENTAMLAMCRELGFEIAADPGDPEACIVKLAISNRRADAPAHRPAL